MAAPDANAIPWLLLDVTKNEGEGVLHDVNTYFAAGKSNYDPGKITVPTLLIHAEWDADLPSYQAQDYFTKLTHAPYRRFVELSEGTHTVMLEKNRMQFFREILNFLK